MTRYDQPQIEAIRWMLDKCDEHFEKVRKARAQILPDMEDDEDGESLPSPGRGYFGEDNNL